MDSLDKAFSASLFGKKKGISRKGGTACESKRNDSASAREARIRLYMERVNVNVDSETCERKTGPNGRPIDIFTGIEATAEDMIVIDVEE